MMIINMLDRLSKRKASYQQSFQTIDFKNRHDSFSIELRKNRRRLEHTKKRKLTKQSDPEISLDFKSVPSELMMLVPNLYDPSVSDSKKFTSLLSLINTTGHKDTYELGLLALRHLLIDNQEIPYSELAQSGIISTLIRYFYNSSVHSTLYIFMHLSKSTPEMNNLMVESGIMPIVLSVFDYRNTDLIDTAIYILGNIAEDSERARKEIINSEGIQRLLRNISTFPDIIIWALSNICETTPPLDLSLQIWEKTKCFMDHYDEFIKRDLLLIVYRLTLGESHILDVMSDILSRLMDFIQHTDKTIANRAFSIFINFTNSENRHAEVLINDEFLSLLARMITRNSLKIKKYVIIIISNLLCTKRSSAQYVMRNSCMNFICKYIDHQDFNIKNEACWCLLNASFCMELEDFNYLETEYLILGKLYRNLEDQNVEFMLLVLKILYNFIKLKANLKLDEHDFVPVIETIVYSSNRTLSDKAHRILRSLKGEEDGDSMMELCNPSHYEF